jgi:hypothetical protein
MITYAVVLAVIGIVSASYKKKTSDIVNKKAYQMSVLHGSIVAQPDHGGETATPPPIQSGDIASGFNGGSVCGDGITDQNILKTVIFKANKGTAVQGLQLQVGICGSQFSTINLGDTQNSLGGVLTKSTNYSQKLYAGNYSLSIINRNSDSMANDGNLTDDQISVMIDGFSVGELPFTRSQSEQMYNLIVNPD